MLKFEAMPSNKDAYNIAMDLNDSVKAGIRKGWIKIGPMVKRTANKNILDKSQKTGITYIRRTKSGARRDHRASAPGETHANMSGVLRRSLEWKISGTVDMLFGYGAAGAKVPPYAAAIEFGRDAGTRTDGVKYGAIEARPSIKNAIEQNIGNSENHHVQSILKEMGQGIL